MTRGHPVLCGVFRGNDKPRVFRGARGTEERKEKERGRTTTTTRRRPARRHCGRKRGLYTYKAL